MARISYLWSNRAKFPITKTNFYKAWIKRIITLPRLLQRQYRRLSLIKKGATIGKTAEIGEVKFYGNKKFINIGNYTFIGKTTVHLHTNLNIGSNVCINDGVELLTASHDVCDAKWPLINDEIRIDNYAWIATKAIILPGVHIGKGAVVGAGAVVSKDVPAGAIVVGNPAKIVSNKRNLLLNYDPTSFLAANRAWLKG